MEGWGAWVGGCNFVQCMNVWYVPTASLPLTRSLQEANATCCLSRGQHHSAPSAPQGGPSTKRVDRQPQIGSHPGRSPLNLSSNDLGATPGVCLSWAPPTGAGVRCPLHLPRELTRSPGVRDPSRPALLVLLSRDVARPCIVLEAVKKASKGPALVPLQGTGNGQGNTAHASMG